MPRRRLHSRSLPRRGCSPRCSRRSSQRHSQRNIARPAGRLPGLRGGVGAALRLLDRLDYRIVVLAPCALDRRQASRVLPARIADLLARERVTLTACCCCDATSAPCAACPPAPALLLRAAHEHGLALAASWVMARNARYATAGRRAGCRTLLLGDGDAQDAWPAPVLPCGAVGAGSGGGDSGDGSEGEGEGEGKSGGQDDVAAYQARDIVDAALAIIRIDGER